VQDGEITYYQGILEGMYVPLGTGDVDVRSIVSNLISAGFDGWFVLEQDNVINALPDEKQGPFADAKASVEFIRAVAAEVAAG
jgi:inosose dehydratase